MDCYCAGKGSKKEKISVVEGSDVITNSICEQTRACIVWLYILYKGSQELPSYTLSSCTLYTYIGEQWHNRLMVCHKLGLGRLV